MPSTPSLYRRNLTLCLAALLVLSAGCQEEHEVAPVSAPAVWRFAIEEAEGSVQHAYATRFAELIEQRSGGQVDVVIYPYGALGTSTHITEQLNMGVLEFAMASPGSLGKFIPELQVFLLHFLLPPDRFEQQALLSDPDLIATLDQLYAPKGLQLLSIYSEGEMVWTMKKQVRSPEDFRGVKMRVMTSPLLLAAYGAYGASPTPLPYSEVYSALQLNMIDGQVNPVFAIERQKFHEVTDWMIFPGHTSFVTTCAANREFIEGLPTAQRELVEQVITELDDYILEVQTDYQTERLKRILEDKQRKRADLHIVGELGDFISSLQPQERQQLIDDNPYLHLHAGLNAAERAAFQNASRQVQEEYLRIGGPRSREILEQILAKSTSPTD